MKAQKTTMEKIITMIDQIREWQKAGLSNKQISDETYARWEHGLDWIYFSIDKNGGLTPFPELNSYDNYYEFFALIGENCRAFPKYSLYIPENLDMDVEFTENKKIDGKIIKYQLYENHKKN